MSRHLSFLSGGGEMGERMRSHDWASTALGPSQDWPQSLRTAISICLNSPMLGTVLWGPDLLMLYNDAYIASMADRHPAALGRPVADVWGSAWDQVSPPFRRTLETGEGFMQEGIELPILRNGHDAITYWDITAAPIRGEDGTIVGLFNQGTETTKRVHAERDRDSAVARLSETNDALVGQVEERTSKLRLFASIMESATVPICAFDTEFRLIAFNDAHNDEFFRVQGFRTKIGDVFPDLFVPEQRPIMRALMSRALTGEAFTTTEEFGNPKIDKPRWALTYSPLRDESGRVIGAFHHAQDISSRLRAEAELSVVQDVLRQSQKMDAVGQLTGGLAHDFNNLLAGIIGSLDLISKRIEQRRFGEVERYVEGAQGAARRAANVTHRLLSFSRRQTLVPSPIKLDDLAKGMVDLIERSAGPAIAIETSTTFSLWLTYADASQVENALLNLCLNARDSMHRGGRISIATDNVEVSAHKARQLGLSPGDYVTLRVDDQGTGMTPDVLERATEPFFTTKPNGQGTGLGLSMIYGFAAQSGGAVDIQSKVGKGTSVCIYLPRHRGEASAAVEQAPAKDSAADGKKTILLVDDEALIRLVLAEELGDLGYTVIEAGDAKSALEIVRQAQPIDVLLTDVGLPGGMNGRQLADAVLQVLPGLPVVFITGYAEQAVMKDGDLPKGMRVLTKPFPSHKVAELVRELTAG